ncbi:SDR family NAD(P)-dependent oxidoreductase [Stakelama pacifica]|uniref:NAD(P)-dependent dehydrogenase (Short-subunit alcohol dehydrogenase family) n=1 Tax=Stakelama pacifica TaxID=517720 RepID=A0A4R6FMS2_9SPHN|nr:SDR family oxidoreductase [Stakelama pacifica]TDN82823.1 NAD(P)-dependent dehydrogenase (short-subunit alcohol dehydrogenase family) [Stakelama pacifica]GGO95490.1 oxidoreductase [Stakelama pacifica]
MRIDLTAKVALVTGGSSGIGFAIAKQLTECGAAVAITGRTRDTIDSAASSIGGGCLPIVADVTQADEMDAAVQRIGETLGGLHIVVANAGVGANAPLGEIDDQKFEKVVGTNLKGVLNTVQSALPMLGHGASIVLMGSTGSFEAPSTMSVYGATKAGMRAFAKTWIKDIKGRGIRINVVSPGAIDTPSLRDALGSDGDSAIDALNERSPIGRIGTPEEVANVVAFFASDSASYINGEELYVDGGLKV